MGGLKFVSITPESAPSVNRLHLFQNHLRLYACLPTAAGSGFAPAMAACNRRFVPIRGLAGRPWKAGDDLARALPLAGFGVIACISGGHLRRDCRKEPGRRPIRHQPGQNE